MADVNLAWTDYQTKLSIARRKGSPEDTANKNVAQSILAELLRQLTFYVGAAQKPLVNLQSCSIFCSKGHVSLEHKIVRMCLQELQDAQDLAARGFKPIAAGLRGVSVQAYNAIILLLRIAIWVNKAVLQADANTT